MALKILRFSAFALLVVLAAAALWLKTPGPAAFDAGAALEAGGAYKARILRDAYGVPHIYGVRDADVAFGLAYAHAEDDWKTIEEVVLFSRGDLARRDGKDAAVTDYLIRAMGSAEAIAEKYETDLSARTRAVAEGYAAGINFYCAEDRARCARDALPVTAQDVVAGFASRQPFFYGLEEQLKTIFEGDVKIENRADAAREAFLNVPNGFEIGSNAMAVAPIRSADGHTRLMVNSHQPYTGPVAWYEARVKSQEGWDMIGGIFPGAPVILHGAGPDLGWAFTVNKPDLVDIYTLETDKPKKPSQYRFDGGWRDFDVRKIRFRVHLWGPFSLPVTRRALYSVHGPVFQTDNGVFAVSYSGQGDIRALEQYYRMNQAESYADWRAAMEMLALPSLNAVYADGDGVVAYYYNAAIPIRAEGPDWSKAQDGSDPALVWRGTRTLNDVPQVVMPRSGYVVNANHTPFQSSGAEDNPDPANFPPAYGVDTRTTNRGLRIQALYGADASITGDEFVSYKLDHIYAQESRVMELVKALAQTNAEDLQEEAAVLAAWDGAVTKDNRSAALAILTAQKARGYLLNDEGVETSDYEAALREVSSELKALFGRVDPEWGEAVRLKRGEMSLPLNGGPDTLRAVYPQDDGGGALKSVGGDTYILYADWSGARDVEIRTIHQFGAATLDKTSAHYADQAPVFAAEEWKSPPMDLPLLIAEATRDYTVGGE